MKKINTKGDVWIHIMDFPRYQCCVAGFIQYGEVQLHKADKTLYAYVVRNNGIMSIFTWGKFWTWAGDEKLIINK